MVAINIHVNITASRELKNIRAPNGLIYDVSEIFILVKSAQNITFFVMKRWREVEHGLYFDPDTEDNDCLMRIVPNDIRFTYERIFPNPITTKFLSIGGNTTITGNFDVFINADMRKMTPAETAWEIAAKNS